jgi:hypothetical protein
MPNQEVAIIFLSGHNIYERINWWVICGSHSQRCCEWMHEYYVNSFLRWGCGQLYMYNNLIICTLDMVACVDLDGFLFE